MNTPVDTIAAVQRIQALEPFQREVLEMRKLVLTGAMFMRLTQKNRLTAPYLYY